METAQLVFSGVGIAGAVVLGILYGLAQRKVGTLMVQLVYHQEALAEADKLREVMKQLEAQIMVLQTEKFDELSEEELADVINDIFAGGVFPDSEGGDAN